MKKLIFVMLVVVFGSADATQIKWTLENVQTSGLTFDGSFIYDTGTNTFAEVAITQSDLYGGSLQFTSVGTSYPSFTQFLTHDGPILSGDRVLHLTYVFGGQFPEFALQTPGTLLLDTYAINPWVPPKSVVGSCYATLANNDRRCTSFLNGSYLQTGQIVGAVVPIPASIYLFLSCVSILGWMRRRRLVQQ